MVECTGLEIRHTGLRYRGFESHPLRQTTPLVGVFVWRRGWMIRIHLGSTNDMPVACRWTRKPCARGRVAMAGSAKAETDTIPPTIHSISSNNSPCGRFCLCGANLGVCLSRYDRHFTGAQKLKLFYRRQSSGIFASTSSSINDILFFQIKCR